MTPIPHLTDAEEARIQAQISRDPDAPEATNEALKAARPFADVFPALAESARRGRGRPLSDNPKQQVTLRLDADIIEAFRATGAGWQGRINEALRRVVP